jgi:fructokinase
LTNKSFRVFGIGEILWDLLPTGRQLGGAPANFTFHAQCLGTHASLISCIGSDFLGEQVLQAFKQKHLCSELIQIDERKSTGTVDVTFSSPGVPEYIIHEDVAWDYLRVTEQALSAISKADAICFGSLSQRNAVSSIAICSLLSAAPKEAVRVLDINLRQRFYTRELLEKSLHLANVLKLNNDELDVLAGLFHLDGVLEQRIASLAETYNLHTIALTRGADGSVLYHKGHWSIEAPRKVNAVDTIGAGDAFTAALIVGLLHELDAEIAHGLAADVAAHVCSQAGGMPVLPITFRDQMTSLSLA